MWLAAEAAPEQHVSANAEKIQGGKTQTMHSVLAEALCTCMYPACAHGVFAAVHAPVCASVFRV
jgi:hypothetical protein